MEYASAVMKRRKVVVNVMMENCSSKKENSPNQGEVPKSNDDDIFFASNSPKFNGHDRSIHESNFLVGRKPGESHVATKQVKDEWNPEATFWITLMIIVFLGILITTCCIMKQRKDENMFYGRRRARRNRRLYHDRTTSTTSTKDPSDITQTSQETSFCNATSATRSATGDAESTVASEITNKGVTSLPNFLSKTMDIPGIGCFNGNKFDDKLETEACNYYYNLALILHPNKEIPWNGEKPDHAVVWRSLVWQLHQQLQPSSLLQEGDKYREDICLNMKDKMDALWKNRSVNSDYILQSV